MAISAESVTNYPLGLPKGAESSQDTKLFPTHTQEINRELSLEEIIQREPTVWDRIRTAAATGDTKDIEKAKSVAKEKGRLPSLVTSVLLFNSER